MITDDRIQGHPQRQYKGNDSQDNGNYFAFRMKPSFRVLTPEEGVFLRGGC